MKIIASTTDRTPGLVWRSRTALPRHPIARVLRVENRDGTHHFVLTIAHFPKHMSGDKDALIDYARKEWAA